MAKTIRFRMNPRRNPSGNLSTNGLTVCHFPIQPFRFSAQAFSFITSMYKTTINDVVETIDERRRMTKNEMRQQLS